MEPPSADRTSQPASAVGKQAAAEQSTNTKPDPTQATWKGRIVAIILVLLPASTVQAMKSNPVTWTLAVIGWEMLVLVGSLVMGVWSQTRPELIEFIRKRVVTAVAGLWSNASARLGGYESKYRVGFVERNRAHNTFGLPTRPDTVVGISEIQIELNVHTPYLGVGSANPVQETAALQRRTLASYLRERGAGGLARFPLVIVGAPGSGKSTLLQVFGLKIASDDSSHVPALTILREHAATLSGANAPPVSDLIESLQKTWYPDTEIPDKWFVRQLKAGRVILLFDGLDEIADQSARTAVAGWIDRQHLAFPECTIIVTARPLGHKTAQLRAAGLLEVQPLRAAQVNEFVLKWYAAINARSPEPNTEASARQARELVRQLRIRPALSALTSNPLLLTMMVTLHSTRQALPHRRIELYGEIVDVLLQQWAVAKGIVLSVDVSRARELLESIAFWMMRLRVQMMTTDEIISLFGAGGDLSQARAKLLQSVQSASGLLLEVAPGRWQFAHLTFQEYFAACAFEREQGRIDLADMIGNPWWNETLRLAAAYGDATSIVRGSLDQDTVVSLSLAADCVDETRAIDEATRRDLELRLGMALSSDDLERRSVATVVRLQRRLRSLRRYDDVAQVDASPITNAEFSYFCLTAFAETKEIHRPDHWEDDHGPRNGDEPVEGVRPDAAHAFCLWLATRESGLAQFRLPDVAEAQAQDYPMTAVSYWVLTRSIYATCLPGGTCEHVMPELQGQVVPSPSAGDVSAAFQSLRSKPSEVATAIEKDLGAQLASFDSRGGELQSAKGISLRIGGLCAREYEWAVVATLRRGYERTQYGGVFSALQRTITATIGVVQACLDGVPIDGGFAMRDVASTRDCASRLEQLVSRSLPEQGKELARISKVFARESHPAMRARARMLNALSVEVSSEYDGSASLLDCRSARFDYCLAWFEQIMTAYWYRGIPEEIVRRRKDGSLVSSPEVGAIPVPDSPIYASLSALYWWVLATQSRGGPRRSEGLVIVREPAATSEP